MFFIHLFARPVANAPHRATIQKDMQIISSAFANNATLPKKYTCQGEGVNPPLSFTDVPVNTKSLALIVDDPDAPSGVFTHWVLFNIPPNVDSIAENNYPVGAVMSVTSAGKPEYVAACPPSGTGVHHYRFKLYALDTVIVLTPNVEVTDLENAMQGHIVASSQLVGLYPEK
ncbi:MAG TPA: YbhB/YbcL family Raf kinase inhibitor-like protein [Patescibacteria group bacterium]